MENGLWNGKLLIATEIAKKYELEKEVRKASGHKELYCPDPECKHPIIRYCHGEKKDAFFAHLNNESCDYADFDKSNTQIIKTIRKKIYEHFKENVYQVLPEVKVIPHHYTHLFFDLDGSKIAVEIGTQQLSANHIDNLTKEYKKKNIAVKWIVIGNTEANIREDKTYFLKRYLLNESENRDLIVISWNGSDLAQYKFDQNKYKYNGTTLWSENYPDAYVEFAKLEDLTFEGKELSIIGFAQRYENWLNKKQKAFAKKINQIEKERSKQALCSEKQEKDGYYAESSDRYRLSSATNSVVLGSGTQQKPPKSDILYEQRKKEILPLMEQQQIQARDSLGKRWIKCEKCGLVDTDDKFSHFGGKGHLTLGVCRTCNKKEND